MCESCNGGGFDRRDFLKISGVATTLGGILATTALAQNAEETVNIPFREKKKTKMSVLFMYPPADVINEGRLEDAWAADRWFTYPGNQFEPEMNQEKYMKKIKEYLKSKGIKVSHR